MKKSLFFIFLFSSFFIVSSLTYSQWVRTNGPQGGTITAIGVDSPYVFIGTSIGDVFFSNDYGLTWNLKRDSLNCENISCFAVNGTTIYLGSGSVYYTTNFGNNWLNNDNDFNFEILSLAYLNNHIFAGTNGNGVYASSNNGSNWYQSSNGLPQASNVVSLVVNKNFIFASAGNGVYISTNLGLSWSESDSGLPHIPPSSFVRQGIKLFAGINNKIYVTSNNGNYWFESDQGIPSTAYIKALVSDNNEILACSDNEIYKSTNGGQNWLVLNLDILSNNLLISINKINNFYFTGTYINGLIRSSNSGYNWNFSNDGFSSITATCLYSNNNNLYSAALFFSGLQLTTNSGNNWTVLNSSPYHFYNISVIKNQQNLLVGTSGQGGSCGIFLSSNNGLNWNFIYGDTNDLVNIKGFALLNNNIFAISGDSLLLSTNNGWNWINITTGINGGLNSIISDGNDLYIASGTGLYKSINGGLNWTLLGLQNYSLSCLAKSNNNVFAGTNGQGVYRSMDNGLTWVRIFIDNYANVTSDICLSDSNIFVIEGYILYYSPNNGANWNDLSSGFYNCSQLSHSIINNNFLYCTSNYGIWKRSLNEIIGIKPISSKVPSTYSLSQNYPNPFNPSTKIKFSIRPPLTPLLSKEGMGVSLKIYDILGCEVKTLINEKLQPGTYETEWNASNFASGVYFYRLEISDPENSSGFIFTETKRMVLLK